VGRSTFYVHCSGKEDLLRGGLESLRSEIEDRQSPTRLRSDTSLPFSLGILEHVARHRDLYPSLGRSRGREVFVRELRQVVLDAVREDLKVITHTEEVPQDVTEQYIVGGFMSLLLWSLERKVKQSPAQLDAMFQRLVLRGIESRRKPSGSR
jgi:AcrR family transcriptional regulator